MCAKFTVMFCSVSEALAEAEKKHEDILHSAEFQFDKRVAAKMVEMMETNAVKQAAAVEKAAEVAKKKVSCGAYDWVYC